jgi:hypothetical protein
LFQTYQFNLMNQLFRHIENRDAKTIAIGAGLQSSIFGLQGLPFFEAINTTILGNASINEGHKDVYSYATQAAGKETADWLLYGTASAFPLFSEKAPALYTRGDLNPRSMMIIPTSIAEIPAVGLATKVVGNVKMMGELLASGSGLGDTLLHGLEHNGVSRPLAGLAQLIKGTATTGSGSLIAGQSDMYSIASLSRLAGAKPMDESIGIAEMYRSKVYAAHDREKLETLGASLKIKLQSGEVLTSDDWVDFQGRFAETGGRAENFARWARKAEKQAGTSVINQLQAHNKTMAGQRMITLMGGDPIEDLNNTPPEQPAFLP